MFGKIIQRVYEVNCLLLHVIIFSLKYHTVNINGKEKIQFEIYLSHSTFWKNNTSQCTIDETWMGYLFMFLVNWARKVFYI